MQRVTWIVRRFLFSILSVVFIMSITSCSDVTKEEGIINYETILALTPTNTPTSSPTVTLTPTPSPTLTPSLTPTPSPTRPPTPTPLPPTPTPNPALKAFSFCNQIAGDLDNGRFSAQATGAIQVESFPAFERLTIGFDLANKSAPLSAKATYVQERDYTLLTGRPIAPAEYVLLVDFPNWLHDDFFQISAFTQTQILTQTQLPNLTYALSNTNVIRSLSFQTKPDHDAGTTMALGFEQPAIYHIGLSRDKKEVRIEAARESSLREGSDELTIPLGSGTPNLEEPLYFLLDGDIWRLNATNAVTMTQMPEEVTDLAVSRDGTFLAWCRTQDPGINPFESGAAVPQLLHVMKADGKDERIIPGTGVNCGDLALSPDSTLLALSADETGIEPMERSIRIVPIDETLVLTTMMTLSPNIFLDDETNHAVVRGQGWNRTGPQWIDKTRLIYTASAPDSRSTLFLLDLSTGIEHDIGADIQVVDTRYRYNGFGQPLVSENGRALAVEAYRSDKSGADLLLLDANGKEQDSITKGFWNRPLAWTDDTSLFYLSTPCESMLVHEYELHLRYSQGKDRLLATGISEGTIGDAVALGQGLVYIASERAQAKVRGPESASPSSPSAIWYWNLDGDMRMELFSAHRGITKIIR
jgi:hypothetical protein